MAEPREELIDEPELEDEEAADVPLRAEAEDEAELGCTVEGGLVRL
jgi:hypothetical protein